MAALIALGIVVVLGGLLAIVYFTMFNRFVAQVNLVKESWKQIDVELQRRFDLIPNLITTVKAYATHERTTLAEVMAARAGAQQVAGGSPAERQGAEGAFSLSIRGVMAVAEAYPDLKANVNFLELQRELANTEERIAAGRRFYNGNVRALNTRIESVPSNIVASMGHFEKAEYFELDNPEARQPVKVSFDDAAAMTPDPTGLLGN